MWLCRDGRQGGLLFEEVDDDSALVECLRRAIVVQLERGDQALGRQLQELCGLLVRVHLVCGGLLSADREMDFARMVVHGTLTIL